MKLKICVAQQKGGSGKTSVTMLVAANLASDSFKVAVVDMDPQGSASLWAVAGGGRFPATVVPATAATLASVLAGLQDHDAVFLDCPPSSSAPETLAALDVADLVVIPCLPSRLDYWATDAMCIAADIRCPHTPKLVIVNQAVQTTLAKEVMDDINKSWPTAKARLGARTVYREAADNGVGVRQLPARQHRDAIPELDALSIEIFTTALKAA